MNTRLLNSLVLGATAFLGLGTLMWWMNATPSVPVAKRVASPMELIQRSLEMEGGGEDELVNLEGIFQAFDGEPGLSNSQWPRFRGEDFNNIQEQSVALSETWPEGGPRKLWSISLGDGHAGPAIWNGRFFILDYDEKEEGDSLRCFSFENGREIWRRWYRAPTKRNHGVSRTVSAVAGGCVVSMGPRCHVTCVDAVTGEFRWGIDLVREYAAQVPLWYTGQCPLIDDGIAALAPGGAALMLGVDCETGKVVWETPNPKGWRMSHSSIMPMRLLGRRMYVYAAMEGVMGVSAEEEDRGRLLWEFPGWSHSVNSPSPVAIDESRIFLTAGYGGGSMMLELRSEGGAFVPEPLFQWDKSVFACEQQTPIYYREHLFGILPKDAGALRGQMVCMDTGGNIVWSSGKTERFGLGPFLLADDKIFILNDTGELTLIKASLSGYVKLAEARVLNGRDAWGPMALVDGKLLLRDSETLVCLDVRATGGG